MKHPVNHTSSLVVHPFSLAALSLLVVAACGESRPGNDASVDAWAVDRDASALDAGEIEPDASAPRFGVTNSVPAAASIFVERGILWQRTMQFVAWHQVEPVAPVTEDANSYTWDEPDAIVAAFQEAGAELQGMLSPFSLWANPLTEDPGTGVDARAYPPLPEYMDDFARFVAAVVERYDHDGAPDDMPGLLRPVRFWQLGNEYYNAAHWGGTPEEYVEMLAVARAAAKQASPEVQIIASEVPGVPAALDTTDPEEIEARAAPMWSTSAGVFMTEQMRAQDEYDIFITHLNGRGRFVAATLWFWQTKLTELGPGRPLWCGDAASGPLLGTNPLGYRDDAVVAREQALLEILASGPTDPEYATTMAWYRAEQAREAVRKPVAAVGAGVRHMYLTSVLDWPGYGLPEWRFHGLIEANGHPRPALRAYALAVELLGSAQDMTALSLSSQVFAYRWTTSGRARYCLWADDPDITDGVEPIVIQQLEVGWPRVRIITPPVAEEDPDRTVEERATVDGVVELELGSTPLFVEEAP